MLDRILDKVDYLVHRPFDYILAAFLRLIFKDDLK